MKRFEKLTVVLTYFVLSIFSSQIFAQSASSTANQNKVSSFQYMKRINSVFEFLQQNYVDELDPKLLYEGALRGMLDSIGDPYTTYMDSDYLRDINDTTTGSFGGVGLSISKLTVNSADKPAYVEVVTPLEDTPGFRAGIVTGDLIIAIDGLPTPEMSMDDVLSHLRGEVGNPVTISILRGKNMTFDVTLVRELIEVPTVKYGMIGKTGYVRLIEFTPDTAHRMQDALDSFEKSGYTSLIVDLRDNPGGLITSAVDVCDKFIDKGPVVTTKSRVLFENQSFNASAAKTTVPKGMPVIILINRGSASASEIVSGCLKDYHVAYLVGTRSYGKGLVQQVSYLFDNDAFKYTVARYYTPSDVCIDKVGIQPDIEVAFPDLTEEESQIYLNLINSKSIEDYVTAHPKMTEADISTYAAKLCETYPLNERLMRRLVRLETQKHKASPLYDLDYDIQLQKALEIIEKEDFSKLMKEAKTLKEMELEAEAEAAKAN